MNSQLSQTIEIYIDQEELVESATETIAYIMAAIFMMNVFDGVATTYWVAANLAVEANPLMDHLLQIHPAAFMIVKLSLIALGIALLWMRREHWLSQAGTAFIFLVYSGLSIYHLTAFGLLS